MTNEKIRMMNAGMLFIVLTLAAGAADLTLDEVIAKMQGNQAKIKDMYAETTTKITSNIQLAPSNVEGLPTSKQIPESKSQVMIQKGKMWTKGEGKSKIEMLSPMKQTTITNGDQMAIINAETGQKMVQDLKKLREKSGQGTVNSGQMSLDKAKEFFELSVQRTVNSGQYVITGTPKKENKFLGKMEFYVDSERWVPVKIVMFDAKGKPISQSGIEYERVIGSSSKGQEEAIWAPVKNSSNISTPMGSMKVEMLYDNVKVNQGISDKEFAIE